MKEERKKKIEVEDESEKTLLSWHVSWTSPAPRKD